MTNEKLPLRIWAMIGARAGDNDQVIALAEAIGLPFEVIHLDDPRMRDLYERRFVLVRPDGHVAWRGEELPADPIQIIDQVRGAG